jgi:hypothetical protein
MEKLTKGILIGLISGLILGVLAGYLLHNTINRNGNNPFPQGRENFQIDEKTKNEITSFFQSTSDINQINSYCQQNRTYCFYYCRSINPNDQICQQIINSSQFGGRNGISNQAG